MKPELKAKFLQYLNQKKQDEGFTLIELLVVIIIIGILSAIALPSFLNQAAKGKQSEAKTYVNSINRDQQAYRLENTSFAADQTALNIGLPTQTTNYSYFVTGVVTTALVNANAQDASSLKSYAGGVVVLPTGATSAAACQTPNVSNRAPQVNLTTDIGASCLGTSQPMN